MLNRQLRFQLSLGCFHQLRLRRQLRHRIGPRQYNYYRLRRLRRQLHLLRRYRLRH